VRYTSNIDKLLSIFEQNYFVASGSDVEKEYHYQSDNEDMALITDILREMASDPEERKEIEGERELLRVFNNLKDPLKATIKEKDKIIEEGKKTIEEKDKTIEEKDKLIEEDKKTIEEKDKTIEEKDKENAELRKKLAEFEHLFRDKQAK
jgi:hypothetical protein